METYNESYSKPATIFDTIKRTFIAAVEGDAEMKEAFERMRKFKGVVNTPQDAKRLDELKARGADKLGIGVGASPLAIGAGLAFVYDIALEAIRLEPERINTQVFKRRSMRTAESLFEVWLLNIGACSVKALQRALEDDEYADRLRHRGEELGSVALDIWDQGQECEHCTVIVKDATGSVIDVRCPSEEECNDLFWLLVILLLVWLTYGIIKWLWD